jgi:hypothetical protein
MPVDTDRYVKESPQNVGRNEKKQFVLDTTPWGGSPTSPACVLYDVTLNTEVDVSATKLSGSPTISGAVITTPLVQLLTAGSDYLLLIRWMKGSEVSEALLLIHGTK